MKDLTGQKFGRLTVTDKFEKRIMGSDKRSVRYLLCNCDCGNQKYVMLSQLTSGTTESCGCIKKEMLGARHKPLHKGEEYGELTIIKELPRTGKQFKYLCKCSCGKETTAERTNIMNGHTTTCGHSTGLDRGNLSVQNRDLYCVYMEMVKRATKEEYPAARLYYNKGVRLYGEWSNDTPKGFENFLDWAATVGGYRKGLMIDKEALDHENLIYGPETCRFVEPWVNSASARKSTTKEYSSKYLGVYYATRDKMWASRLKKQGEFIFVEYSKDELALAILRDQFIKDNNLPHRLNFPNE